jgi:hypothetical protein
MYSKNISIYRIKSAYDFSAIQPTMIIEGSPIMHYFRTKNTVLYLKNFYKQIHKKTTKALQELNAVATYQAISTEKNFVVNTDVVLKLIQKADAEGKIGLYRCIETLIWDSYLEDSMNYGIKFYDEITIDIILMNIGLADTEYNQVLNEIKESVEKPFDERYLSIQIRINPTAKHISFRYSKQVDKRYFEPDRLFIKFLYELPLKAEYIRYVYNMHRKHLLDKVGIYINTYHMLKMRKEKYIPLEFNKKIGFDPNTILVSLIHYNSKTIGEKYNEKLIFMQGWILRYK